MFLYLLQLSFMEPKEKAAKKPIIKLINNGILLIFCTVG